MIYPNKLLFYLTGETSCFNEIERSLYNHIPKNQSPIDETQAYYIALCGHKKIKTSNIREEEPLCCISSFNRCMGKITEIIYARSADKKEIVVLLYNGSTIKDKVISEN